MDERLPTTRVGASPLYIGWANNTSLDGDKATIVISPQHLQHHQTPHHRHTSQRPADTYAHIGNDLARIENPDIWAEGHKGGIHLEVDDHVNAEDATAILGILAQKALRGMDGFGLDIFAPFLRCPKFNATRRIANILADTYDIVEEMLGVKIWILAIRNIGNWLNADDTVQGEIE